MMNINISTIVPGTVFTYLGKEFRLTTQEWGSPSVRAMRDGQATHVTLKKINNDHYEAAKGASPKLGGMFQDNMTVWIPANALVDVE